ncbi:MAG: 50S ribosomal protein L35 [Oscillospiraceae bacterium]|jgi:large subunit ribosomal protein L35|nr:50S ribosomal protein L35 [Oscillospiraceae bacterium]
MPKLKTHSGASKRFKLTKSGKVKRSHAFTGHDIKGRKNAKKKRALRRPGLCDKTNEVGVKRLLPYM